jgi:hypothetical protein
MSLNNRQKPFLARDPEGFQTKKTYQWKEEFKLYRPTNFRENFFLGGSYSFNIVLISLHIILCEWQQFKS